MWREKQEYDSQKVLHTKEEQTMQSWKEAMSHTAVWKTGSKTHLYNANERDTQPKDNNFIWSEFLAQCELIFYDQRFLHERSILYMQNHIKNKSIFKTKKEQVFCSIAVSS